MAGNPNCLVYNMYIMTVTYAAKSNAHYTFDTLYDALYYLKEFKFIDDYYDCPLRYSIKYRKEKPMTTKDLLDYLDARLRDAKRRYDEAERDIILGEINAINYIYKYLTDDQYRRIANGWYSIGGDAK